MRARLIVLLMAAGCSSRSGPFPDGSVAACDRVGASITDGNVTARAYAGGVIHLHYGEATPPSWAVVQPASDDPSARISDNALCTDTMTVVIDHGRVKATLADGTSTECWIYVYDCELRSARPIVGGCWRSRGPGSGAGAGDSIPPSNR